MSLVLLVVLVGAASAQFSSSDYCRFSGKHTMCRYKGVAPECSHHHDREDILTIMIIMTVIMMMRVIMSGEDAGHRGVSDADIKEILDYHNRLRSRVASGQTSQPPASDMVELAWDKELATIAQAHADQCKFRHDCTDCRTVERFKVGQNLYQSFNTRNVGPNWRKAIDSWFNEIDAFPVSSVSSYKFSHKTGHYSQMVWGSTTRIGCGSITYKSKKFNVRLYTCNYGQSGNILRRRVYKVGGACGDCPCGTACSDTYPGLCSKDARNSSNPNMLCMLDPEHMMHMTMHMAHDLGEGVMDTMHVTGDMAMHTAHGVGHLAMDTVHNVGHAAMDTVHGVGDVAFNTVNTVNKFVVSPVNNLVNTGFNFAFSPFLSNNPRKHFFRRPG